MSDLTTKAAEIRAGLVAEQTVAEWRAAMGGVTPGPWYSESVETEGSYGSGEDTAEGFDSYVVRTEAQKSYGEDAVVCDALNSGTAEVHEEFDEDGTRAWDEPGRCTMAWIARCSPTGIAPLLALIEQQAAELAKKDDEIKETAQEAQDAVLSMIFMPGVRAALDALPEDDPIEPYLKRIRDLEAAESERDELLREKERLGAGWRDLSTVPEDEMVIVATTGGWVGEATVIDREWKWAAGNVFHPDIVPLKWMPLPQHPDVMAEADELPAACLTSAEQKQQASRCACRGADDYCPCQNAPDATTIRARSSLAPLGEE